MSCDALGRCLAESAYRFFDANGFMVELAVAALLFTWWLRRRRHASVRFAVSACALLCLSVVWNALVPENTVTLIVQYAVYFAALAAAIRWCYDVRWSQALFHMTAAGTMQHFAFRGARIVAAVPHMVAGVPEASIGWLYPAALVPMYVVGYVAFARPLKDKRVENLGYGMILPLLAGMSLCVSVFTNVFNGEADGIGDVTYTIFALFDLVNCIFLLALLREIVDRSRAEENSTVLQRLLEQQKTQLESSKETIDLINVKTHDLKKQIAMLGDRVDPDEIEELGELVDIYDSSVRTGNEALDVVLKQKSLVCERRRIQFDRMVDGRALAFMRPADIYALFGNAIDNALEALADVAEPDRYLHLDVRETRGMLAIRVENPYRGSLEFEDGLPHTTKGDERYHGFGTRSIRMIVERYGGYLSIDASDGVFLLTALIPLRDDASRG